MKIYNLVDKMEFLEEVSILEYEEWALDSENNKKDRLKKKIENIKKYLKENNYCKLILLDNNKLVGFISIFPHDCDELPELTPWYATMFVKKEYRGNGCSKILNDAILKEAKKRDYKAIYLKTNLVNYYEKFGAKLVKIINNNEKIYKFEL